MGCHKIDPLFTLTRNRSKLHFRSKLFVDIWNVTWGRAKRTRIWEPVAVLWWQGQWSQVHNEMAGRSSALIIHSTSSIQPGLRSRRTGNTISRMKSRFPFSVSFNLRMVSTPSPFEPSSLFSNILDRCNALFLAILYHASHFRIDPPVTTLFSAPELVMWAGF